MTETSILVGVILGAHGIKGEVKVKTFTQSPQALHAYGPLILEDGRQLEIAALRAGKGGEAIVRFAAVTDRTMAEKLKGVRLYIPRAALPEPDTGEFYHADLIGLNAEDASGNVLGTVRAVHNFGAGDVLEIAFSGGASEFLPFTDASVPQVDIAAGRIVIVPPQYDED